MSSTQPPNFLPPKFNILSIEKSEVINLCTFFCARCGKEILDR